MSSSQSGKKSTFVVTHTQNPLSTRRTVTREQTALIRNIEALSNTNCAFTPSRTGLVPLLPNFCAITRQSMVVPFLTRGANIEQVEKYKSFITS